MKEIDKRGEQSLLCIITSLKNHRECLSFLKDLLTEAEYRAVINRIRIAELLTKGMTYAEISDLTKSSTATICRINRALNYGNGGLASAIERMQ